jgi:hypothetical protein
MAKIRKVNPARLDKAGKSAPKQGDESKAKRPPDGGKDQPNGRSSG